MIATILSRVWTQVRDLVRRLRTSEGRELAWIVLGRAAQVGGQLATVRLGTELLSPGGMGAVAEFGSVTYAYSILLVSPVQHYVNRGFLGWAAAGSLGPYLRKYFRYICATAFVAGAAGWIVQTSTGAVHGFGPLSVGLLSASFVMLSSTGLTAVGGLNLLRRRAEFAMLSAGQVWAGVLLGVAFCYYSRTALLWSVGQVTGMGVGAAGMLLLRNSLRSGSRGTHSDGTRPP